ncbi:MAG: thiamine phosphate synthase [Acidobacteria bacterium]|nr:thiamine phosphate synthase [Acidobacteriota bacterium]
MEFRFPPIYPITDKRLSGKCTHLAILKELVRGGATLVQIRDKGETPVRELLDDLRRCVEFARERGVILVVDDRCDLMLSCGADGVHLGTEDLPAAAARRLLGHRRIIGLSTHNISQVRRSRRVAVDYIGFGPIHTTATKDSHWPATGIENLRRACALAGRPVVAIGGIGPGCIRDVLLAGAASAAVISSVMAGGRIARRMEALLREATAK